MHHSYRTRHASGIPGWGPAPGWGQPLPGWSPLVDHGPLPLRAAGSLVRWWWPILAVGGFLAVVVQVLDHDHPAPGLSQRGLVTIALAAAVVVLLTVHRSAGPLALARAVAEYGVVALLAGLLAAVPGGTVEQQSAPRAASAEARPQAAAGDNRPGVVQAGAKVVRALTKAIRAVTGAARWVADLWHKADQLATSKGEAMPVSPRSPTPPVPSIWRSRA